MITLDNAHCTQTSAGTSRIPLVMFIVFDTGFWGLGANCFEYKHIVIYTFWGVIKGTLITLKQSINSNNIKTKKIILIIIYVEYAPIIIEVKATKLTRTR